MSSSEHAKDEASNTPATLPSEEGQKRGNAPKKRPPAWMRVAYDQLWIVLVPLFLSLFGLTVQLTNTIDLSDVPPHPRVVQLGIALAAFAVILGVPYLLCRKTVDEVREDLSLRRQARFLQKNARRCLSRYKDQIKPDIQKAVVEAVEALERALEQEDNERVFAELDVLDKLMDKYLTYLRKGSILEVGEPLISALIVALLLRAFVIEAFKIPSGSMIPTLQVGDHIFVNKILFGLRVPFTNVKFAYHLREPKRGEVIVFVYPHEQSKDYIKRVAAVAGDTIEACGEEITINGQELARVPHAGKCEYEDADEEHPEAGWQWRSCRGFRETNGDNTYNVVQDFQTALDRPCAKWSVPKGHVFVLGDNRDHSADSRFWCDPNSNRVLPPACESGPNGSFVPLEMIKGKAWFIWWSAGRGSSVRFERLFSSVH